MPIATTFLNQSSAQIRAPWEPQNVKAFRASLGMSQAEFAAFLGLSVKTVISWESGSRQVGGASASLLHLLEDLRGAGLYPFGDRV